MALVKSVLVFALMSCQWEFASADSPPEEKVEPGKNATLKCESPRNATIIAFAWVKRNLESDRYVFFYRENRLYEIYQHESFKGRVVLGDPHMKDGNVSVILQNTTTKDSGIYECQILVRGPSRTKRDASTTEVKKTVQLIVQKNGQTGGHTEDGGKEEEGKENGVSSKHLGLVAIGFFAVTALVSFVKLKKKNSPLPPPPEKEADQQLV